MKTPEQMKALYTERYDIADFPENFQNAFAVCSDLARKIMVKKLVYKHRGPKHNKQQRLPKDVEEYANKFAEMHEGKYEKLRFVSAGADVAPSNGNASNGDNNDGGGALA